MLGGHLSIQAPEPDRKTLPCPVTVILLSLTDTVSKLSPKARFRKTVACFPLPLQELMLREVLTNSLSLQQVGFRWPTCRPEEGWTKVLDKYTIGKNVRGRILLRNQDTIGPRGSYPRCEGVIWFSFPLWMVYNPTPSCILIEIKSVFLYQPNLPELTEADSCLR